MRKTKLEICCGNINDVLAIKGLDYDRIELNSALELGGLTPSIATLRAVKQISDKPVMCMVRTRGSGFVYSDDEIKVMLQDAQLLLDNGADGIVFGILNCNCEINIDALKAFRAITGSKQLVFHKAFDCIDNQNKAIETLIEYHVNRILLMGKEGTPLDHCAANIAALNSRYGNKIELLPGGGINEDNILSFIRQANVSQIHGTFKESLTDSSTSTTYLQVSRKRVETIVQLLNQI